MHLSLQGWPVPIIVDASSRTHEFYPLTKVYIVISRERTKFDAILYSQKCYTRVPSSCCSKPSMLLRVKTGDFEMASQILHGLLSTYPKPNLYHPASTLPFSLHMVCSSLRGLFRIFRQTFALAVPCLEGSSHIESHGLFSHLLQIHAQMPSPWAPLTTLSHATTPSLFYCFPLHLS